MKRNFTDGFRQPKLGLWDMEWVNFRSPIPAPPRLSMPWKLIGTSALFALLGWLLPHEWAATYFLPLFGMAQLPIPYGSVANDPNTANDIDFRTAWQRTQDNFTDLYALQSRIVNAGDVRFASQPTTEARIQAAIDQATIELASAVFVPAFMFGYDASAVTFNPDILMVREGGDFTGCDVVAYGAIGDDLFPVTGTDNAAAWTAALDGAEALGLDVFVPEPPGEYSYRINSALTLREGVAIKGTGGTFLAGGRIKFGGAIGTLFYWKGASEAADLNVTLENLLIDSATIGVGIGLRARDFNGLTLRNVQFVHFDTAVWADWGQNLRFYDSSFVLCNRGLQLGGNLSQTIGPIPGAGISGGALYAPYLDDVMALGCTFSTNKLDINYCGSSYALGGFWLVGAKFFEGSTPVTGKLEFVRLSGSQSAKIARCDFESPHARAGIRGATTGADGETNGPNYGVTVDTNTFLFTTGTSSSIPCDLIRGTFIVTGNTFVCAAGALPIQLSDTVSRSVVRGDNTYMTFINGAVPTEGFTTPITITGAPTGGHDITQSAVATYPFKGQFRVGSGSAVATVPAVLFQLTNRTTTSTTDTSLPGSPYSLPGSSLAATAQAVRILASGRQTTQAGVFHVQFGGTDVGSMSIAAGESWYFEGTVSRTSSGSVLMNARMIHGTTVLVNATGSIGLTMANAQSIDFRGSVTSGGTLALDYGMVEYVAA